MAIAVAGALLALGFGAEAQLLRARPPMTVRDRVTKNEASNMEPTLSQRLERWVARDPTPGLTSDNDHSRPTGESASITWRYGLAERKRPPGRTGGLTQQA
jgi:hypothetical protein